MTLSPLTELDAVNEMLLSIGQAPVSTLSVPGIRDVSIAQQELARVSRAVQLQGWHWNTDEGYSLSPAADGVILAPPGLLRFEVTDRGRDLTLRRKPGTTGTLALYDRTNHSFTFDAPVAIKAVWGFPFEDLPETARTYISIAAARKFQARTIGSRELDGFNAEDEDRAWTQLIRDERATRNTNIFRRNRSMQRLYNRSGTGGVAYP